MNIDKTTFMGLLQAISSILAVFGMNHFEDPDTKEAIWTSWIAFVGVIAGFKGYFSKSTDKELSKKEQAEIVLLNQQARKIQAERYKIEGEGR